MKLSLFGVGDAGTRLLNEFVQGEADTGRNFTNGNVLAFNTAAEAFGEATVIPEERQILIGDTHPEVNQYVDPENDDPESAPGEGEAAPSDGSTAPGVDGDPDLGATVAGDELPEIRRALDLVDDTEVDAAMLVVGLGGGTGAGVGSVLLEELESIYECPIYVLGVLPASTESDQRR
ncbi:MAG: cell division GTPase [uncultured archaeon A07HN63]|nr:MAG: cell division GTPase [uncultured archaeon A07HN63]